MKKAMDLYAYWLEKTSFNYDRLNRITERILKREPHLTVRPLNLRHFDEEVKIIKDIFNNSWSKNWGFVPMTEGEIDDLAKNLKPIIVPELVLFAYWGDTPVGFSAALPDYNVVLKHLNGKLGLLGGRSSFSTSQGRSRQVRIMLLGVKHSFQKKGVEGSPLYRDL